MSFTLLSALVFALFASGARAESHTVRFYNGCGTGTPQLYQNGDLLSSGEDYTVDGTFYSAIAFLQTGDCSSDGNECTLIELSLDNPVAEGSGSSADISLISPHTYNVAAGFAYWNGCDNTGTYCDSADCNTAFFESDDTEVQVACQDDNVNILIAFCADATTLDPSSLPGSSPSTTSSATPTPTPTTTYTPTTTSTSSSYTPTTTSSSVVPTTSSYSSYSVYSSSSSSSSSASSSAASASASSESRCPASSARRSLRRRAAAAEPEPAHDLSKRLQTRHRRNTRNVHGAAMF